MPYIGKQPIVGNFQVCDAISVVNGQAAYTMQVASTNVEPENANHMLVSLNGILQKPGSSFTISGSTITFASNLATGDVIDFIILLGDVLNIGAPSDDTVATASIQANAVTAAKLNNDIISGLTELTSAPADTDEFLISDAGTIKRIDASLIGGGGKINQVVSTHTITNGTMSSNSFADISGVTVDITPSASDSKILIFVSLSVGQTNSSVSFYKLLRDSTVLGAGADAGSRIGCSFSQGVAGSGSSSHIHSVNYNYLDSPSTTSQITYKVQAASYNNALLGFNRTTNDANDAVSARPSSVITAMEVLA